MIFHIDYERDGDDRRSAEMHEISAVLSYGATAEKGMAKSETLALRVSEERIE